MTRMNRELLKQAWLSIPADKNKVEIREIRVISNENKDWFIVKTITDVKEFYSSSECGFNTLKEAIDYVVERNKESDSYVDYSKYKLVIN
tara:strand:- start:247 stop:516 length:270 start_codon:yes stop_codon:yes gene_type:complete